MTDGLDISGFLRGDEVPHHVCAQCGDAAEFGYKIEGTMQWFCDKHKISQHYADARLPKAAQPAPRKDPLAEHANAIRAAGRRTIENLIEIGRHLTEARELCERGQWQPWLQREFGWADETAFRFMRVHKLARLTPQIVELDIPLSGLYLLAAPNTPPEAREEVFERAADGERVSVAQVKKTITETKQAKLGRKQSTKKHYGDSNRSPLPIQHNLLARAKPPVELMNRPTRLEFAKWFDAIYLKEPGNGSG